MGESIKPVTSRRGFLLTCGGAGASALAAWRFLDQPHARDGHTPDAAPGLTAVNRTSHALGSDISILALHESSSVGETALDAAFAQLNHVERVMSIYLPDSQVSLLNTTGRLANPDPYLVSILQDAQDLARRSDGAFDITVQSLWSIYAAAQRQGRLPSEAEIHAAQRNVNWRQLTISGGEIRFERPGMSLTLNGIAQGFAADRAMEALVNHGIKHALVNTGEVASLGRKAGGAAWIAGIQHPRKNDAYLGLARLEGRCLSTSGDYETTFTPDKVNNHIFEPATGRSPQAFSSVTVLAPTATEADALSTAIFVMGPERGMALTQASQNTDVLLVAKDGQTIATEGFPWNS